MNKIDRSVVVYLAIILMACISLTAASDNRCNRMKTVYQTKTRTQLVAVTETYLARCRKLVVFSKRCTKTRVVHQPRIETYREAVEVPESVCCDGYAENATGRCVAQCPNRNCEHGRCSAPDQCECNDGYALNVWARCEPQCDHCSHGICIRPNECECVEGYHLDQDDLDSGCQPVCDYMCINGHCVGPNQCQCKVGYQPTNEPSVCEARCDPPCDSNHGQCIAPDQCECYDGYELSVPSNECQPVCENGCVNGICMAPDHCECYSGFHHHSTNDCRPVCQSGCSYGACIAPEHCQCDVGFEHEQPGELHTGCVPTCNPACGSNAQCNGEGKCECNAGYHMLDNDGTNCEPICDTGCTNGMCIAPNHCECAQGFANELPHLECHPICDPACNANGFCFQPGQCQCLEGYRMANDSGIDCRPVCEPACTNAACVAPNLCECHDAHEFELGSGHRCRPRCEPECVHGECVAPDRCQCAVGYDRGTEEPMEPWKCAPQCGEAACTNGFCAAPGICGCNAGFEAVAIGGNATECRPVCTPNCGTGSACVAPNICECLHGFEIRGEANITSCDPVCEKGCENGFCEAPNRCACREGFERVAEHQCRPRCDPPCVNGFCASPGVCGCDEGYAAVSDAIRGGNATECRPQCAADCGTGAACVAPNKCECLHGYRSLNEPTKCEPVCDNGCDVNGFCEAPNRCACAEGFAQLNGSKCEPHCDGGCDGECRAPNVCVTQTTLMTSTSSMEFDTSTPEEEPREALGFAYARIPCVPFCSDWMPRIEQDGMCVKCDPVNHVCLVYDPINEVRMPSDVARELAAHETTDVICGMRKIEPNSEADLDHTEPIYGLHINCTHVGCDGGACDTESGQCTCDREFLELPTEMGNLRYACINRDAATKNNLIAAVDHTMLIVVASIGTFAAMFLVAAVYAVFFRKTDHYPRDQGFMDTASNL